MLDTNNNNPVLGRDYPHLMRGPRFAWWRPLLTIPLALLFMIVLMLGLCGIFALAGQWQLASRALQGDDMNPVGFGFGNLMIAAFIPATMLATRIMYGVRSGYLSSVAGRFRWGWTLRCAAITVPLFVITFALDQLINGPQGTIPAQQGLLLLLVLTTTPLQAAGEEYLFRGLLMQNVGAWFRHPTVALVVTTALSTALFAAAHGSADWWILLDLGITALAACVLIWRTGGIEAAVVLHAANNVVGMVGTIFVGGWEEGFVDDASVGRPMDLLLTILVTSVTVPLVLKAAARHGIQRIYQPAEEAVGSRRMNAGLWFVVIAPAALAMLVAAGGVVMLLLKAMPETPPRLLHYADVATRMGISGEGCFKGYQVQFLPIEIRHYETRELVADDVVFQVGEQHYTGSRGMYLFPVSAELMAGNPQIHVVLPGGKTIAYRYQFKVDNQSLKMFATCPVASP
jgi:CAAX protease family protein